MKSAALKAERSEAQVFDHSLNPYFARLRQFNSTAEMKASSLYRKLEPEIRAVLEALATGSFAPQRSGSGRNSIRAAAWNVERGLQIEGICEILATQPLLAAGDLFLLTELDDGMARTQNRNIPRLLAESLRLNYVFAPSYINLEKGSGLESRSKGENRQALHGNALFARHPILDAVSIPLENGKDKMRGREKRLGSQRAVAAVVDHPLGRLRAVSAHLDAHASQKHRMRQMRQILDHLDGWWPELPVLIGGDWNTSTYNSSRALYSILGYARRVLMGVGHVLRNHYPYPDRWFERHLFSELEGRGYHYRDLNEPGGCTLHYDVNDLAANGRMADWIPNWCFWFINWALQKNDGRCSMKLDWFAGKDIRVSREYPPRVIAEVHDCESPLSDHDPIIVDFHL